jgi:hypothetical protein
VAQVVVDPDHQLAVDWVIKADILLQKELMVLADQHQVEQAVMAVVAVVQVWLEWLELAEMD